MTSVAQYRLWMFTYGILTILYLLERLEDMEEYAECQKIVDAIEEQNVKLDGNLPTKITKETMDMVIDGYKKFGLTGKNAIHNHNYYADLLMKEIQDANK